MSSSIFALVSAFEACGAGIGSGAGGGATVFTISVGGSGAAVLSRCVNIYVAPPATTKPVKNASHVFVSIV
jgi:hypothetical protein